jgi:hypothetical protein
MLYRRCQSRPGGKPNLEPRKLQNWSLKPWKAAALEVQALEAAAVAARQNR